MSNLHKKLVANKLEEICYCLAVYFNYLIIPRKGFFIVSNEQTTINVEPAINYSHIIYLLNEIYPCSEFNYKIVSNVSLDPIIGERKKLSVVPQNAKTNIRKTINNYIDTYCLDKIDDPLFKTSLKYKPIEKVKINDDVITKIYSYYVAYNLSLPESDEEIKELQLSLLTKRTPMNYGLNSDIENTALQSIIYIITALVDSIGIKEVGINEVISAYNILIPKDLKDDYTLSPKDDESIKKILIDAFNSKNLIINNEGVQLLTDYIDKVDKLKEKSYNKKDPANPDIRVLNRLMGFSSWI